LKGEVREFVPWSECIHQNGGRRKMGQRRALELLVVLVCSLFWGSAISAQGTLRVGAARVDITPPADPAHRPSGKYAHEKLYVRAIVLDNGPARAALVGADQGGLFEAVWQAASKQIAAELNCPVENIVMSATHTHSGWGPGGFPGMRGLRQAPNAPPPLIVGQILDAVRQAKANL
jgi:neutral ceramidase